MKRSILLITTALLVLSSREAAAQLTESQCPMVLPGVADPGGGFCGLQFWQPDTQECFSTLKAPGTLCTPAASSCEKPSICGYHGSWEDLKMSCTPLGTPQTTSKVCRAATAVCDQEDRCDGTSLQCPFDRAAPDTTLCRASAGACDVSDYCDGVSKNCDDDFVPVGETCRESEDQCDVDETCDGTSAFCPEDELADAIDCDDGDECTDGDTCTQGVCIGDGINSCPAEEPDAGPGDETPDTDTSPGDPDAGVGGDNDAGDSVEEDGAGGCSVSTGSSPASWTLLFLVAFVWTRRRKLSPFRSASRN